MDREMRFLKKPDAGGAAFVEDVPDGLSYWPQFHPAHDRLEEQGQLPTIQQTRFFTTERFNQPLHASH